MNDRFKFRYYNKLANKMVEPTNWQNLDGIYECIVQQICFDNDIAPLPYNHIGEGLVFMQCTGLKDENGTLIYEGDIVKVFHVSSTGQGKLTKRYVVYDDTKGRYILCGNVSMSYITIYEDDVLEVIGNIYENPELLEDNQ